MTKIFKHRLGGILEARCTLVSGAPSGIDNATAFSTGPTARKSIEYAYGEPGLEGFKCGARPCHTPTHNDHINIVQPL
jgi:hypothetical protein